jgi:membrane protein implicated in regulation of membrane protease activity
LKGFTEEERKKKKTATKFRTSKGRRNLEQIDPVIIRFGLERDHRILNSRREGAELKGFNQFRRLPKKHRWRVIKRFALFQIPDMAILGLILVVLGAWVDLPSLLIWGLVSLWVLKDVFLFPLVWRAYDQIRPGDPQSLIGVEGVAEERLAPSGYVRVHGELWHAEVKKEATPVEPGEKVTIQGAKGLTLLVQVAQEIERNPVSEAT